jgi:hypothetical protein
LCFFLLCSISSGSNFDRSGTPPPPSALLVASSRSCNENSLCFLGGENKVENAHISATKPTNAKITYTLFRVLFRLYYTSLYQVSVEWTRGSIEQRAESSQSVNFNVKVMKRRARRGHPALRKSKSGYSASAGFCCQALRRFRQNK